MKKKEVLKQKFADAVVKGIPDGPICNTWILYQPKKPEALKHKSEERQK